MPDVLDALARDVSRTEDSAAQQYDLYDLVVAQPTAQLAQPAAKYNDLVARLNPDPNLSLLTDEDVAQILSRAGTESDAIDLLLKPLELEPGQEQPGGQETVAQEPPMPRVEIPAPDEAAVAEMEERDAQYYGERRIAELSARMGPLTEEDSKRMGLPERFITPGVNEFKSVVNVGARHLLERERKEAIDIEVAYRLSHGLYRPNEARSVEWLDWYQGLPPEYQTRLREEGFYEKYAGSNFVDSTQLRKDVDNKLMSGVPLQSSRARYKQADLYKGLGPMEPNQVPEAAGVMEKIADFAGNVAVLVAELRLLRGPTQAIGRAAARGVGGKLAGAEVAGAGETALAGRSTAFFRGGPPSAASGMVQQAVAEGTGFGAIAAAHGEDPYSAFAFGAGLGATGVAGRVAGGKAGAIGANMAYFSGTTALEGGGIDDVLIAGVLAPLMFNWRDILRFAYKPSFHNPRAPLDWHDLAGDKTVTGRTIYGVGRIAEIAREQGGLDPSIIAELKHVGASVQKTWKRMQTNPKDYTAYERDLMEGFIRQFNPEIVTRRTQARGPEGPESFVSVAPGAQTTRGPVGGSPPPSGASPGTAPVRGAARPENAEIRETPPDSTVLQDIPPEGVRPKSAQDTRKTPVIRPQPTPIAPAGPNIAQVDPNVAQQKADRAELLDVVGRLSKRRLSPEHRAELEARRDQLRELVLGRMQAAVEENRPVPEADVSALAELHEQARRETEALPVEQQEILAEIAANEGELAVRLARTLLGNSINTIETHADGDRVAVRVEWLSPENRAIIEKIDGARVETDPTLTETPGFYEDTIVAQGPRAIDDLRMLLQPQTPPGLPEEHPDTLADAVPETAADQVEPKVTPQIPNEPGQKYVLPSVATHGLSKGAESGKTAPTAPPAVTKQGEIIPDSIREPSPAAPERGPEATLAEAEAELARIEAEEPKPLPKSKSGDLAARSAHDAKKAEWTGRFREALQRIERIKDPTWYPGRKEPAGGAHRRTSVAAPERGPEGSLPGLEREARDVVTSAVERLTDEMDDLAEGGSASEFFVKTPEIQALEEIGEGGLTRADVKLLGRLRGDAAFDQVEGYEKAIERLLLSLPEGIRAAIRRRINSGLTPRRVAQRPATAPGGAATPPRPIETTGAPSKPPVQTPTEPPAPKSGIISEESTGERPTDTEPTADVRAGSGRPEGGGVPQGAPPEGVRLPAKSGQAGVAGPRSPGSGGRGPRTSGGQGVRPGPDRGDGGEGDLVPADGGGGRPKPSGSGSGAGGGGGGKPEPGDPDLHRSESPTGSLAEYRILPDDVLFTGGTSGNKGRIRENIAALKLLKEIQAEGRPATPEEQAELIKFSGWGSNAQVFIGGPQNSYHKQHKEWKPLYDELAEVLDKDELGMALESTNNAMYTSNEIIQAMWSAVRQFGFKGGRVLEPSMGIGHFFGAQPPDLRKQSTRAGVEIEPISAGIASLLYPNSNVTEAPFQDVKYPREFFDLVISNVPFGDQSIFDADYPKRYTATTHDYFFTRAVGLTRPGGIIAFITSKGTMDKTSAGRVDGQAMRSYWAEQLDLLGAIRLNDKALPGTKVTADIIFLQKRGKGVAAGGQDWIESVPQQIEGKDKSINQYFVEHPEMVMGEIVSGSQYGEGEGLTDTIVKAPADMDLPKMLAEAVARLPEKIMGGSPITNVGEMAEAEIITQADKRYKDTYTIKDGKLLYNGDAVESTMARQKGGGTRIARLRGMIDLRDVVLKLLKAQATEGMEQESARLQHTLNTKYDAYVRKHKPLHESGNMQALKGDIMTKAVLLSLEKWDRKAHTAEKTDIFTKRVMGPPEPIKTVSNVSDLVPVLMAQRGRLDMDTAGELLGVSAEEAKEQLLGEGNLAFETPSGLVVPAEEYLSGNVRDKLHEAEAAVKLQPDLERNVKALKRVQPEEVPPSRITASLGVQWVPLDVVEAFTEHLFEGKLGVKYTPETGAYIVTDYKNRRFEPLAQRKWGTPDSNGVKILGDLLNLKEPEVRRTEKMPDGSTRSWLDEPATLKAIDKGDAIKAEWKRWLWSEETRVNRLVPIYNEIFNNIAKRQYDGSHLTFPGMNPWWKEHFRPYAANAVYRIIVNANVLLYHAVGSGKTIILTTAAMELRRLGIARKILISVDNATFEQFPATAKSMYPAAKILAVGPKQINGAEGRQKILASIATQDWDIIIMPHSTFEKIPVDAETTQEFFEEHILELEAAEVEAARESGKNSNQAKELAKARKRLKEKLKKQLSSLKKDTGLHFNDLGIDQLMYDESQAGKNLFYATKMQRVKGLGNPEGSDVATDLLMKSHTINRQQNGRGVVFASGTPISNSVVEMYTVMKYLIPDQMEALGVRHLDGWIRAFAEVVSDVEATVSGGYAQTNRLRNYNNVMELMQVFRNFTDTFTAKDLEQYAKESGDDIDLPDIKVNSDGERDWENIVTPDSPELAEFMETIGELAQWIKGNPQQAKAAGYNFLVLTTLLRKAALDLRLVMPELTDLPESKVKHMADKVYEIYLREADKKGTQLVAMNMGMNEDDPAAFSLYDAMTEELIRKGIPEHEIARIHDFKDEARGELFERVNDGEVRVLMGSIAKMGVGVNVQKRLKAEHMADPPWRPSDVKQFQGRGVRPSNANDEVELYRYVTKGSGDEFMYGVLWNKQKFLDQVLESDSGIRSFEDESSDALSAAQIMAVTSRNPIIMEYQRARNKARKLEAGNISYNDTVADYTRTKMKVEGHFKPEAEAYIEEHEKAFADAQKALGGKFSMTVGDKTYTKHKEAGQALLDAMPNWPQGKFTKVGEYAGIEIMGKVEQQMERILDETGKEYVRNTQNHFVRESVKHGEYYLEGMPETSDAIAVEVWRYLSEVIPQPATASRPAWIQAADDATGLARKVEGAVDKLPARAVKVGQVLAKAEKELATSQAIVDEGYDAAGDLLDARTKLADLQKAMDEFEKSKPAIDTSHASANLTALMNRIQQERQRTEDLAAAKRYRTSVRKLLKEEGKQGTPAEVDAYIKEHPEPSGPGSSRPTPDEPSGGGKPREGGSGGLTEVELARGRRTAGLSADQMKYLREMDRPGFGMGAAMGSDVPLGPWKKTFDRIKLAMTGPAPGTGQAPIRDFLGKMYKHTKYGVPEHDWDVLSTIEGASKLSKAQSEKINFEITKHLDALDIETGTPAKANAANRLLGDVFDARAPVGALPPPLRKVFDTTARILDDMTDELLSLTHLHPYMEAFGLLNVVEVIQMGRDLRIRKLRRLYKAGDPTEAAAEAKSRKGFHPKRNVRYRNLGDFRLKGGSFKHRRSDADSALELWTLKLADGKYRQFNDPDKAEEAWQEEVDSNKEQYGESVYKRVQLLDPFGAEIVERMEPIDDVRIRIAKTIAEHRHNLQMLKLLDYANSTVAVFEPPEGEGYQRIMDHPVMGPLAGKYVPGPWATALMAEEKVHTGMWPSIWNLFNRTWKLTHVVYNLPTYINNIFGLHVSWSLARIHPVIDLPIFRLAVRDFADQGPRWTKLVKANRINTGFSEEIVRRLERELDDPNNELGAAIDKWARWGIQKAGINPKQQAALERIKHKAQRLSRKLAWWYDAPDQLSIWVKDYKNTAQEGMSDTESMRNLAMFPNYSEPGWLARWARRSPAGEPFVMFPDQYAKIGIWALREFPGTLLGWALLPGMITLFSTLYLGLTEEELTVINARKSRKSPLRRYFQPVLPWRDERGRPATTDLRWKIPFGDEFPLTTPAGLIDLPFVLSTPLTGVGTKLMFGRDRYWNAPIWKESDPIATKLWKGFTEAFWEMLPAPRSATVGIPRVVQAAIEAGHSGEIGTLLKVALKELLGIKITSDRVSRRDALKVARQKYGESGYRQMARVVQVWNRVYREKGEKSLVPNDLVGRYQREERKKAEKGR